MSIAFGKLVRILLIAQLLAGCSMADIKGRYDDVSEKKKNKAIIVQAEQYCAKNDLVMGTSEYDICLDVELEGKPIAKAQLDMLRADYAQRATDGTLEDARKCEDYGYFRGTDEYTMCLDYQRDNKRGGPARTSVSK